MARGDELDKRLEAWARTRRELLGLADPRVAKGILGPLRCTLGARRDLHSGAKSLGRIDLHWPEVYTGQPAELNRAFKRLREDLRIIIDVHYVLQQPKSRGERADLLGLKRDRYYERVRLAKAFLAGALGI